MHPSSGDGDPAKSGLGGTLVGEGGSNDAAKGSKKVSRRPVPVLVPAMPPVLLAPIAPAVIPSTTAPSPAQQQAHVFAPAFATTTHPPLHQNHHPYHQQQQLVPASAHMSNIATAATTVAVPQYLPTPLVFMNQKLRCGKWAAAEEAYAVLLIEYFEKGIIVECENGVTLRSFLSRKLHCSPMRISKKYAGLSGSAGISSLSE